MTRMSMFCSSRCVAKLCLSQVQLELPHILGRGGLRRAAEEGREASDLTDVIGAGLLDEMAHRHVVDHALAQRADGCLGHRGLLS